MKAMSMMDNIVTFCFQRHDLLAARNLRGYTLLCSLLVQFVDESIESEAIPFRSCHPVPVDQYSLHQNLDGIKEMGDSHHIAELAVNRHLFFALFIKPASVAELAIQTCVVFLRQL